MQSNDDGIRDAIIRSTNNQTAVEPASLYATDKIQRDIEDVLRINGLFYERRKNQYVNQRYSQSEIITPLNLGAGFVALGLKVPLRARSFGNRTIQNRIVYERVFGHGIDLNIWVTVARTLKKVDEMLEKFVGKNNLNRGLIRNWRYTAGFLSAVVYFGKFTYSTSELICMEVDKLSDNVLD